VAAHHMNPDFIDLLHAFLGTDVRFLVVGAHMHSRCTAARGRRDLDIRVVIVAA
jgi:hypothetical protein